MDSSISYREKALGWAEAIAESIKRTYYSRKNPLKLYINSLNFDAGVSQRSEIDSLKRGEFFRLGCDDNPSSRCINMAINRYLVAFQLGLNPKLYAFYNADSKDFYTQYDHALITVNVEGHERIVDTFFQEGFLVKKESRIYVLGRKPISINEDFKLRDINQTIDFSHHEEYSSLDEVMAFINEMKSYKGAVRTLCSNITLQIDKAQAGPAIVYVSYSPERSALEFHLE